MDITLATCALLAVAPIWLFIAVAIKLDSPGPVFFRQERIGRAGKPFRIFKFRSMTADACAACATRSRSTTRWMGRCSRWRTIRGSRASVAFMRRTSLDELPQLINVVRGEMSLVGPRPLPTDRVDAHRRRRAGPP